MHTYEFYLVESLMYLSIVASLSHAHTLSFFLPHMHSYALSVYSHLLLCMPTFTDFKAAQEIKGQHTADTCTPPEGAPAPDEQSAHAMQAPPHSETAHMGGLGENTLSETSCALSRANEKLENCRCSVAAVLASQRTRSRTRLYFVAWRLWALWANVDPQLQPAAPANASEPGGGIEKEQREPMIGEGEGERTIHISTKQMKLINAETISPRVLPHKPSQTVGLSVGSTDATTGQGKRVPEGSRRDIEQQFSVSYQRPHATLSSLPPPSAASGQEDSSDATESAGCQKQSQLPIPSPSPTAPAIADFVGKGDLLEQADATAEASKSPISQDPPAAPERVSSRGSPPTQDSPRHTGVQGDEAGAVALPSKIVSGV